MLNTLKANVKMLATRHHPGDEPNVFIHSLPRSGSTWLMELILTQPGFQSCNEPLNLRTEAVRDHLGINEWKSLHCAESKDKIFAYLDSLHTGRLRDPRFDRAAPFTRFYRPVTHRTVFKIINAGEEHINWFSESFNGRVLYLLRHPVAVSLSRKYFPKLETILESDIRQYFDEAQLRLARTIIQGDEKFARGVLDWCLRNSVALRSKTDAWTVLSYEQLVQDPVPAVHHMAERLHLPRPDRILSRLAVPSQSTSLSDRDTRAALQASRDENKQRWLVEKWRQRTTTAELELAGELLAAFNLNSIYSVSEALPDAAYWIS